MKHILNVLKNEIFNQNKQTDGLVKKITASQEAYLKDRKNEKLFNAWSENVKGLQKIESNQRFLLSAYATICAACEMEPMTIEEIIAEKNAKATKKASRYPVKKEEPAKENQAK